jgi:hypothetical protein
LTLPLAAVYCLSTEREKGTVMASLSKSLAKARLLAKSAGLTLDEYAEAVTAWKNATEGLSKAERRAVLAALRSPQALVKAAKVALR